MPPLMKKLSIICMTALLFINFPDVRDDIVSDSIAATKSAPSDKAVLAPIVQKYIPPGMPRHEVEDYLRDQRFVLYVEKPAAASATSTLYARYKKQTFFPLFGVDEEIHLVVVFVNNAVKSASGKYIYLGQ